MERISLERNPEKTGKNITGVVEEDKKEIRAQ